MFLETEITRTLTALQFLLAVLIGVAPIVVTLWVKLVLYRPRTAEDNEDASLLQKEREATQARERLQGRYADMLRKQFTQMDTQVASYNAQSTYLTQNFA